MKHHAAGLARLTSDREDTFVGDLIDDYRDAKLSARERALLDYADKLTRTPGEMQENDLVPLREAGLSDEGILDANLTVAYFAYVNRIADGLGVALDEYMNEERDRAS